MTVRWGHSPLDRRQHAVDETRDHPRGSLRAECGHLLAVLSTRLRDEPAGPTCGTCAQIQADRAVTQVPEPEPSDRDRIRPQCLRTIRARWAPRARGALLGLVESEPPRFPQTRPATGAASTPCAPGGRPTPPLSQNLVRLLDAPPHFGLPAGSGDGEGG